ncbi:Helix-turn-helix domain-containing protein [Variovorax sp. YR266]|uniref:helix-turn-helix domain-containing protein n=1 Tax=Variovorax sp. YR266 TaxID=1884386 RepID=UPI000897DBA7|nr:helix-turn-helix transcriptional regulator [Variovorax sp. YR266]SDZ70767.1 Helix-turn-helix domain-containing protein [Variovorax sp. YR266]
MRELTKSERELLDEPEVRKAYDDAAVHLSFGAALRQMRLEAGMTQVELHAATGVDQADISRSEREAVPSLAMLQKVAEATGFDVVVELRKRGAPDETYIIAEFDHTAEPR